MNKDSKRMAIGTTIAAAAGYIAGILTAPKSGKETRTDIKNVTIEAKVEAEKKLKQLHTEANDLLEQAQNKGHEYQGKAKNQLDDLIDKTKQAKQKSRVLLSAIHEGDADDKDLQKVILETSKAIKHLRAFLTK